MGIYRLGITIFKEILHTTPMLKPYSVVEVMKSRLKRSQLRDLTF